jgi:hypothetical protein
MVLHDLILGVTLRAGKLGTWRTMQYKGDGWESWNGGSLVSHRRASLIGHLIGVPLTGVHLTGVHLLYACLSHRHVSLIGHLIGVHLP